jgi:hypothetical protein
MSLKNGICITFIKFPLQGGKLPYCMLEATKEAILGNMVQLLISFNISYSILHVFLK